MSQSEEFSISELRRKRAQSQAEGNARPPEGARETIIDAPPSSALARPLPDVRRRQAPAGNEEESQSEWSVDIWRVLGALKRRWLWLLLAAVVMGSAGFAAGYLKGKFSATIKLIQTGGGGGSDSFHPEVLSATTLTSLIQSPDLVRRVAKKASPAIAPDRLAAFLSVEPELKSEIVRVTIQGADVKALVDLVNLYAIETVAFTRDLQLAEGSRMKRFYEEKVAKFDAEQTRANDQLLAFLDENKIIDPKVESESYLKQLGETLTQIESKRIEGELAILQIGALQEELAHQSPAAEQLAAANARLSTLLARYTEQHPLVQDVRAEIAALERRMATGGTNVNSTTLFPAGSMASTLQARIMELKTRRITLAKEIEGLELRRTQLQKTVSGLSEKGLKYSGIKAELDSLQLTRGRMGASLREAQLYGENAQGYYRVFAPITADDVDQRPRMKKAMSFGFKGALAGLVIAAALVFLVEMKDRTMKTVAEVERITGLRVLASLGDLDKMTPQEQEKWAFRTWTIIAGQLSMSANHGMVCGVMSSVHGEGRSTWIRLLGNAASQRGLRVLTVATKASGTDAPSSEEETQASEHSFSEAVDQAMAETRTSAEAEAAGEEVVTTTLSPSVLAFPAEVAQRFAAGGLPAAHIPLPGWVWNLERRRQWQSALAHWRAVDNLVLLVELPPASVPESVLLAENLPQILWLVDSGRPNIRETKEQLEMLHHAKCRIVGAVLNHEPEPIIKL